MRAFVLFFAVPVAACATMPAGGVQPTAAHAPVVAWHDPSPHEVRLIGVEPDVRLEVLDWGGSGPAMVFLNGLGGTAHGFDDFAPRFRDAHRVLAITRRGYGASSRPRGGYDSAARARDVLAVLDSMLIERAILVGASIAGDELSTIAAAHPERVLALVYLDAYDYGDTSFMRLYEETPQPPIRPMGPEDSASVAAARAYLAREYDFPAPESEVRALFRLSPEGRVLGWSASNVATRSILGGITPVDYRRIRAPALAIYQRASSAAEQFPRYGEWDEEDRARADHAFTITRSFAERSIERFRTEVERGEVLIIPEAKHTVHYSHPDEVERAMRDFLRRAGAQPARAADVRGPMAATAMDTVSGVLHIDGYELGYRIEGSGPVALVIGSAMYYPRVFSTELRRSLRMVFLDGRHFAPVPAGAAADTAAMTLDTFVDEIEAARAQLDLGSVILIGHSQHGLMAAAYADRHPAHVSQLVIVAAPPGGPGTISGTAYWNEHASAERKAAYDVAQQRLAEARQREPLPADLDFIRWYAHEAAKRWYDYDYDQLPLWQGIRMNMPLTRQYGRVAGDAIVRLVPQLPMPVLAMLGEHDYPIPPQNWQPLAELPHVSVHVFRRSGHNPMLEEPAEFDRVLLTWLAENSRRDQDRAGTTSREASAANAAANQSRQRRSLCAARLSALSP